MSRVLPILFNTDMVRAILDGRKTVTRRCVKYKYSNTEMKMRTDKYGTRLIEIQKDVEGETYGKNTDGSSWHKLRGYVEPKPPYQPGDILYVRETWNETTHGYNYKASPIGNSRDTYPWRPSIHMPKEAARIWLKVTDVRVEQLKQINGQDVLKEGLNSLVHPKASYFDMNQREMFEKLWNSTFKKSDIDRYGWEANPWVWVIEFERCEKPKEEDLAEREINRDGLCENGEMTEGELLLDNICKTADEDEKQALYRYERYLHRYDKKWLDKHGIENALAE